MTVEIKKRNQINLSRKPSPPNEFTMEDLADRVDCLARNVSRILQLLARDNKRKEDQERKKREQPY